MEKFIMENTAVGWLRRFSTGRITEHWLNAFIFLVLVVTGLVQKFHALDISDWIIMQAGGIDAIRLIHRIAGVAIAVITVQHLATAFFGVLAGKWPFSMLITMKDVTDAVKDLRYYLCIDKFPSAGGRYTYKQKFEYWGVLTGQIIMIATGLALWFPAQATMFLPGQIIPAAKALHTNEAMLVVIIIAVWHIYNAIFSPDVFPLDRSIFTGRISLERMRREHPLELARMERAGQLDPGPPGDA
jgi:cytochrome b subunit of formate dehydrogenase